MNWWANSKHVFLLVQTRNPTLFLTAGYFRWILCKMLIQFTSGRRNSSIKQLNRCTPKVSKAICVCNFLLWHHMMYFFQPFNRIGFRTIFNQVSYLTIFWCIPCCLGVDLCKSQRYSDAFPLFRQALNLLSFVQEGENYDRHAAASGTIIVSFSNV